MEKLNNISAPLGRVVDDVFSTFFTLLLDTLMN